MTLSKEDIDRLFTLIDKSGGQDSCWNWLGSKNTDGYGRIRFGERSIGVHRAAYIATIGEIPEGLYACHKCDNRACANPAHIFLGTQADNMRDCKLKGRTAQTKQAYCRKGHPMDGDNLYLHHDEVNRDGIGRQCVTCRRDRYQAKRARHLEKYGPRIPKTHCAKGHPVSGENLFMAKVSGKPGRLRRRCRTCCRAAVRASEAKRRAKESSDSKADGLVATYFAPVKINDRKK